MNRENIQKLNESFQYFYKKYNFTGKYNISNKSSYKDRKINKFFSKIINKNKILKDNIFFYLNCIAFDQRKKIIFNPKNIGSDKMKKIEKINLIVKKIVKFKSGYKVYCLDKNNKEIILNTKKLILAAGTVSTTRLVAQMLKYKKKIKIKHNPMIFEPL